MAPYGTGRRTMKRQHSTDITFWISRVPRDGRRSQQLSNLIQLSALLTLDVSFGETPPSGVGRQGEYCGADEYSVLWVQRTLSVTSSRGFYR